MNEHVDPFGMLMDEFRCLGRADKCRALDDMIDELGPTAPIPVFEDIRLEAESWAALNDIQTKTIYLLAIWWSWDAERRQACIDWMEENKGETSTDA